MSEKIAFKDYYGLSLAKDLATRLLEVYPQFPKDDFIAHVEPTIESLELKARVALIAEGLRETLPDDYPTAMQIISQLYGEENPSEESPFDFGYWLMPIAYFVEVYGHDHFEVSMEANYEITKRHTAEFSIRPYLEQYPDKTLERLQQWVNDPNPHIRRLVSEGTRPRLPWASRLQQFIDDPTPTLELLEQLKNDDSLYVRKSVANHLNDHLKAHPELVLDILERWNDDATDETRWILRHALRNLLKEGHPRAMKLFGYGEPMVSLGDFTLNTHALNLGETLEFDFTLHSESDNEQKLMIDYVIHFMKANGKTSPKVFKLTEKQLPANDSLTISKSHTIKPITTRTYYAGDHRIEIQVNGEIVGGTSFELVI